MYQCEDHDNLMLTDFSIQSLNVLCLVTTMTMMIKTMQMMPRNMQVLKLTK